MTHVQATAGLPRSVEPPVDPELWLPEPRRRSGSDQWTVALPLGPWHHDARVRLGRLWHDGDEVGRTISWHVVPRAHDVLPYERLFPPVMGEVVVLEDTVRIRASYEPPAGIVGRTLDVVGRRVARRAVHQMAQEIARALAAHAAVEREGS